MNKTLYVSDLDGTLLNESAELSGHTESVLNKMIASGLDFTIATARTHESALQIMSGVKLIIPIILMNGVLIFDMENNCFTKIYYIDPETVASFIRILKSFETTGFVYELKDGHFMTYHESTEQKPLRDFIKDRIARYNKKFCHADSFNDLSHDNIVYLTLLDNYERLKPINDELAKLHGLNMTLYKDNYTEDIWYLEVFSNEASKQNSVLFLKEFCRFDRVIGFGDNLNDLPMFAACDVKIAVENARPEVIAAADFVCGANTDDGVVKWLEENYPIIK